MSHALDPAIKIFWHNGWMLRNAVADLKPDQMDFSVDDCNSYGRIIGHIVVSRHGLTRALGIDIDNLDWGEFGEFKLAAQFDTKHDCPPAETMMDAFASITKTLTAGMESMTSDDLAKASPIQVPGGDPTMLDLIAFFAMHESYHIGQLGVLSKCMGRSKVMGG